MSTICTSGAYLDPIELDICNNDFRTDDEKKCAGCGLSPSQMIDFWANNNCSQIYSTILFSNSDGSPNYNPENLPRVQADVNATMSNYFSAYSLTDPNASNPFQQTLLNMCRNGTSLPGVCDNYFCNRLCGQYSYDQISNNPYLANWCGCYVPPSEAEVGVIDSNLGTAVVTSCDSSQPIGDVGNVPCYPLCHRIQTVQLYQPSTGCQFSCNNTVCVIDDVSLNVAESQVDGVSFTQMCPACSPNQACDCIISSSDMPQAFEEMGIDASFSQFCSPGLCYELDDAGRLNPIPCDTFFVSGDSGNFWTLAAWIFVGIVVLIVIVILLFLFAAQRSKTLKEPSKEAPKEENLNTKPKEFTEPSIGPIKYSWQS